MDNLNQVWNTAKVFPDGRMQDMDTRGLTILKHQNLHIPNEYVVGCRFVAGEFCCKTVVNVCRAVNGKSNI